MEDEEGDALLEAMLADMEAKMIPYLHRWQPGELRRELDQRYWYVLPPDAATITALVGRAHQAQPVR